MSLSTSNSDMYKKFVKYWIYVCVLIGFTILIFNTYVDPFNLFELKHVPIFSVSKERHTKAAFLSNNKGYFKSVMIGSSRSSYIDTSEITKDRTFNFSVSGIDIKEYLPFLNLFSNTQGVPETIYLSLDFHGTNKNAEVKDVVDDVKEFSGSWFLKILEYAKIKVVYESMQLLYFPFKYSKDYYTRDFIKHRKNKDILNINIINDTLDYYLKYNLKKYSYMDNYVEVLHAIKNAFPNSKFLVIVCPIHTSLQNLQLTIAGENTYNRWLEDIRSVFGEVIDFNTMENIVSNPSNFFDSAHFYPHVGSEIIVPNIRKRYFK